MDSNLTQLQNAVECAAVIKIPLVRLRPIFAKQTSKLCRFRGFSSDFSPTQEELENDYAKGNCEKRVSLEALVLFHFPN